MRAVRTISGLIVFAVAAAAVTVPGDAQRGAELFRSQRCITCHSVNGQGGTVAPDLARRSGGRYTPAVLAATLWNHAPRMWQAMEQAGIPAPSLDTQQSADLFAFFYSHRYGEELGDAGRGKSLFASKGCAGCHTDGPGPPVSKWETADDPIQLARVMWNHAPAMKAALGDKTWPQLTAQDMTDLTVFARNYPGATRPAPVFAPASPATGEELFKLKGCAGCHTGARALEGRIRDRSLAALAAAMWDHAPQMRGASQEIRPEEMSRLVGYLWSIQYFSDPGDPANGRKVLEAKGCESCHGGVAPAFSSLAGKLDAISFTSAIWQHGPTMLKEFQRTNRQWPRFENHELNDLLAYLDSL